MLALIMIHHQLQEHILAMYLSGQVSIPANRDRVAAVIRDVTAIKPLLSTSIVMQRILILLERAPWTSIDSITFAGLSPLIHHYSLGKLPPCHSADAIDHASAAGRLDILEWWFRQTVLVPVYTSAAIDHASEHGHIHVLRFWEEKAAAGVNVPFTNEAIIRAIMSQRLNVLEWWVSPDRQLPTIQHALQSRPAPFIAACTRAAIADFSQEVWHFLESHRLLARERTLKYYAASIGDVDRLSEFFEQYPDAGDETVLYVQQDFSQFAQQFDQAWYDAENQNMQVFNSVLRLLAREACRGGHIQVLDWIAKQDYSRTAISHAACVQVGMMFGHVNVLGWLKRAMGKDFDGAVTATVDWTLNRGRMSFLHAAVCHGHDAVAAWFINNWLLSAAATPTRIQQQISPVALLACIEHRAAAALSALISGHAHVVRDMLTQVGFADQVRQALVQSNDMAQMQAWETTFGQIELTTRVLVHSARLGQLHLLERALLRKMTITASPLAAASSHGHKEYMDWWASRGLPVKLTGAALEFGRIGGGNVALQVTQVFEWWVAHGHGPQGVSIRVGVESMVGLGKRGKVGVLEVIRRSGFMPDVSPDFERNFTTAAAKAGQVPTLVWASGAGFRLQAISQMIAAQKQLPPIVREWWVRQFGDPHQME